MTWELMAKGLPALMPPSLGGAMASSAPPACVLAGSGGSISKRNAHRRLIKLLVQAQSSAAWLLFMHRSIKTWDRTTFAQHSVAEHAADLAAPLCWQPNGRHLYTALPAQEGTDGHVRLYETNGLMHGGFDLLPGSGLCCSIPTEHPWILYLLLVLFAFTNAAC